MSRLSRVLAAAVLLSSMLSPLQALADDREKASALFAEGNEFRLAGKYKEALDKYNAAYKLLPSFKIEYNTALVLEKFGNYPAAYMTYKSFLISGAGKSPEKLLKLAKEKVAELKKKIALLKVTSNVPGATVKVNGIDVGKTPLPGDWEMAIKAPKSCAVWIESDGYQAFTKSLHLEAGQAVKVEAVLQPVAEATPAAIDRNPIERTDAGDKLDSTSDESYNRIQKRRSKTIWAWTTLGAGLACAAGAGVLYGVGRSQVSLAYDEYKDLPDSAAASTFNEKWSDVESASKLYIGGHVLAGVAVAAIGVSVYMFVTRPTVEKEIAMDESMWSHLGVLFDAHRAGLVFNGGF